MANVNASIAIDAPDQGVWDGTTDAAGVVHGQAGREAKDSLAALKPIVEG